MGFLSKLRNKKQNKDQVLEALQESRVSKKYEQGLKKSKDSFTKKIKLLSKKHLKIEESYFDDLEELLILADLGADYTANFIEELKKEVRLKKITETDDLPDVIFELLFKTYFDKKESAEIVKLNLTTDHLNVILVIGVNGVGKTTSIGKLTKMLKNQNYKVGLVAGDTFRAGAVAQLKEWAARVDVPITVPLKQGQDPASVVYQGIANAKADNLDVLIIDTAGRLQNKVNLMNELIKINKIILRESGFAPVETLLVLDATTGQNGISQASGFNEVTNLTGIILTKMDSSSKGGIILPIKQTFNIPVKFIGFGESLDDLIPFNLKEYLLALTEGVLDE